MYFGDVDIVQVVIFGVVGVVAVMILGWLVAFFLSVFFRILGITITGEGCMGCLSATLAAAVTGVFSVVGAVLTSDLLPRYLLFAPELPESDLVPPSADAFDPTLIIVLVVVLIVMFLFTFLVVRRTLRRLAK